MASHDQQTVSEYNEYSRGDEMTKTRLLLNNAISAGCVISLAIDSKRKTLLSGMANILAICPDKKPGESLVSDSK